MHDPISGCLLFLCYYIFSNRFFANNKTFPIHFIMNDGEANALPIAAGSHSYHLEKLERSIVTHTVKRQKAPLKVQRHECLFSEDHFRGPTFEVPLSNWGTHILYLLPIAESLSKWTVHTCRLLP